MTPPRGLLTCPPKGRRTKQMAGIRRAVGRILAGVAAGMIWTGSVWAEPTWIQIEAKPDLPRAADRARDWAEGFSDLGGFRMRTGWYALALGPFADPAEAQARLEALRAAGLIPEDSYLADQAGYREQFWPAPEEARQPQETATPEAPVVPQGSVPPETLAESQAAEARLSRSARMELQSALQWLGFYDGAIDGAYGPGTRAAIARWQNAQGAPATGVFSAAQRDDLLARVTTERAALGLQRVVDDKAGISIDLPMTQVHFDRYDPPFAFYTGPDVTVLLISRTGDRAALAGLYDTLQSLSLMPVTGERKLDRDGFTLEGADDHRHAHAQAGLSGGLIKGFLISYPASAEAQMGRTLAAMKASFRPVGSAALDPALGPALSVGRADLTRGTLPAAAHPVQSGFYIDASGAVLTAAAGIAQCETPLIEDLPAKITFHDPDLGIAVLTPEQAHVPPGVAALRAPLPAPGGKIALAGFSYPEAMAAPVVTLGTLSAASGIDGQPQNARLSVRMLPGDAGGPVLDAAGAVLGMALPATPDRILPEGLGEAVQAKPVAEALRARGLSPAASPAQAADLAPAELARRAAAITVRVGCAESRQPG
ncbi:peptidoglycan-binding protein [Sinirhodobacter populi]|uniref:Peptidoglycan-binding protein n=2 Tax=Paenirhodobacter populi TaxID=2306993 RepID=A0A443KQG9_9RHOB|nr:peptidoglycan-binding protein [Sinirhodobacter populi]